MGATATIADFIVKTTAADFPAGSSEKAIKVIADTFAVILAGVSSEVAEPLQRYLEMAGESGASPVLVTNTPVAPFAYSSIAVTSSSTSIACRAPRPIFAVTRTGMPNSHCSRSS